MLQRSCQTLETGAYSCRRPSPSVTSLHQLRHYYFHTCSLHEPCSYLKRHVEQDQDRVTSHSSASNIPMQSWRLET